MELILIRHGETDSNKKGTYLGWTDVQLNNAGIQQAKCVADRLKESAIHKIHSSPLKRAKTTAEIINEYHSREIEYIDCLKERNFGIWDNMTYTEISERYPQECEKWNEDWFNYKIEDGESCVEVYKRVISFIDKLISGNNDDTVLVVTHLGCVRIIVSYLLGMPPDGLWRFRVDNCGITKLIINNEKFAYLTLFNA